MFKHGKQLPSLNKIYPHHLCSVSIHLNRLWNCSFPRPPLPVPGLPRSSQVDQLFLPHVLDYNLNANDPASCSSLSQKFLQTLYCLDSADARGKSQRRFICMLTPAFLSINSKEQFITAFKLYTGVAECLGYRGMPSFFTRQGAFSTKAAR